MNKSILKLITGFFIITTGFSAAAHSPAPNVRLTGSISCQFLDHPDFTAEYSAVKGKGDLTIKQDGNVVMKRDIFLTSGTRCSSYDGTCFTVVNAGARLGDDFKITVQGEGEDYNSPDFYSLEVSPQTIRIADTTEYFSRLHLAIGYKNAPAPFDQQNILKMVCNGELERP